MPSIESNRKAGQDAVESGQLVRATTPAVNVAAPTPPLTNTNQSNTFLRTPLPASYVQQPDQQRSWQAWGVTPQSRVPPLPPASNAQAGAQAASQATVVVAQTPPTTSGSGGGVSSVGLALPANVFSVSGSPVTTSGTLTGSFIAENPGTFFRGPGSGGLSGLEGLTDGFAGFSFPNTGTFTLTATPTTASSWGIYSVISTNGASISNPPGWTGLGGNGASFSSYLNQLSGTSAVSITQNVNSNSIDMGMLAIFNGTLPTIAQQANTAWGFGTTQTLAFPGSNTAGNFLIVIASLHQSFGATQDAFSLSVTDSAGNTYTTLSYQQNSTLGKPSQLVAVVPSCLGGANTVTFSILGPQAGGSAGQFNIVELTAPAAGAGLPFFGPLLPLDIPPINLNATGNGGISNILGVVHGGTGADLSATGGTSQFLRQNSTGATVTVIQPDFSDLAGAATKLATKYNGISLVSDGLPSEVAKVDLTAQGAAITATTLYAVPAAGAGMYRISWVATVTQAAATPAVSVLGGTNGFQILYTDNDTSVVKTMPGQIVAGVDTNANNSTATGTISGCFIANAKASTNIQYQMDYSSSGATPMQYNLHIKLEAL